jgi:hypothetical protein
MNPRIRELAVQAGAYISEPNDWKMVDFDTSKIDLEKFAELIVKECCDWIDGSPANDAGQLHLTKSFIIANLKGMFRSKE